MIDSVYFSERHIFLDTETTGLNPTRDRITEIAAVAVQNGRIDAEFHRLINPEMPIPPVVQQITGLTDLDVADAPLIQTVLPDLSVFCGSAPIIAHNAGFDRSFLENSGFHHTGVWMDGLEAAVLLRPDLPRHGLTALKQVLQVGEQTDHRALADARSLFEVIQAMATGCRFSVDVIEEMIRILQPANSPWIGLLKRIAAQRQLNPRETGTTPCISGPEPIRSESRMTQPVTAKEVDYDYSPKGRIGSRTGMEPRKQQKEMSLAVARCLSEKRFQMIEAGTGVGKSLAYLYPAAVFAMRNQAKVAVSTHTKVLQDQLAGRELPRIREILGENLQWVVLKGRENYGCLRRLQARIDDAGLMDSSDIRLLMAGLWAGMHGPEFSGELDGFAGWLQRRMGNDWHALRTEIQCRQFGCAGEFCRFKQLCPAEIRLQRALIADVLVVNHSLMLRWPRDYPTVNHVIFDEVHTLESDATSVFGEKVEGSELHQVISRLKAGSIGRFKKLIGQIPKDLLPVLKRFEEQVHQLHRDVVRFVRAARPEMLNQSEMHTVQYDIEIRLHCPTVSLHGWELLKCALLNVSESAVGLVEGLPRYLSKIPDGSRRISEWKEDILGQIEWLKGVCRLIQEVAEKPQKNRCYYIRFNVKKNGWSLIADPVQLHWLMKNDVWDKLSSAVLTSATLTVPGNMQFVAERIGFNLIEQEKRNPILVLGSPFDFPNQMHAVIPVDVPRMQMDNLNPFLKCQSQSLMDMARLLNGRTLYLSNARFRMKLLRTLVEKVLRESGITVLMQGDMGSDRLLEMFREDSQTVLMGVRSFWEGVDVPGKALSAVMIEKVPFPVRGQPLHEARCEALERQGRNGFRGYSLPLALLQLRQGVGRLIRQGSDCGFVVLMSGPINLRYRKQVLSVFPVEVELDQEWSIAMTRIRWLAKRWGITS